MVAPWVEFTFGDMYNGVPGFIENLSYSIPDNAPYEIDGIELPKVIEASMGFKYVGNHLQTMQGKHFDLPWLRYDNDITVRKDYWSIALNEAGVPGVEDPRPPRPDVPLSDEEADLLEDIPLSTEFDLGG